MKIDFVWKTLYVLCYWNEYRKIKWLLNKLWWWWHKVYKCHHLTQIKEKRNYELFVLFYNKKEKYKNEQKQKREQHNNFIFRNNL